MRETAFRLAAEGHDVELVELNQSLVLTDSDPAKNFFQPGDGVHPGQSGYDQLGALWFSALTTGTALPTSIPAGVPTKRDGLSATVRSATGVELSWIDPASDETSQEIWCQETSNGVWRRIATVPADATRFPTSGDHTGFRVERRQGNGAFLTIATIDGDETEYIDSPLEAGASYSYRIYAVNEAGESESSPELPIVAPTNYDTWAAAFPELLSLGDEQRLPGADPNHDGLSNLLAYAFGRNPLAQFDPALRPNLRAIGEPGAEVLQFRFIRNIAATDLEYRIERSTSLSPPAWSTMSMDAATTQPFLDDPVLEEVSLPIPRNGSDLHDWFRLVVTRNDKNGAP